MGSFECLLALIDGKFTETKLGWHRKSSSISFVLESLVYIRSVFSLHIYIYAFHQLGTPPHAGEEKE